MKTTLTTQLLNDPLIPKGYKELVSTYNSRLSEIPSDLNPFETKIAKLENVLDSKKGLIQLTNNMTLSEEAYIRLYGNMITPAVTYIRKENGFKTEWPQWITQGEYFTLEAKKLDRNDKSQIIPAGVNIKQFQNQNAPISKPYQELIEILSSAIQQTTLPVNETEDETFGRTTRIYKLQEKLSKKIGSELEGLESTAHTYYQDIFDITQEEVQQLSMSEKTYDKFLKEQKRKRLDIQNKRIKKIKKQCESQGVQKSLKRILSGNDFYTLKKIEQKDKYDGSKERYLQKILTNFKLSKIANKLNPLELILASLRGKELKDVEEIILEKGLAKSDRNSYKKYPEKFNRPLPHEVITHPIDDDIK